MFSLFCYLGVNSNAGMSGIKFFPFNPKIIGEATLDHIKYIPVKIKDIDAIRSIVINKFCHFF